MIPSLRDYVAESLANNLNAELERQIKIALTVKFGTGFELQDAIDQCVIQYNPESTLLLRMKGVPEPKVLLKWGTRAVMKLESTDTNITATFYYEHLGRHRRLFEPGL